MKKKQFGLPLIQFLVTVIFMLSAYGNIHAQLQDSFDDSDFTTNPTWTGSTENFVINASGQLQLNDLDPVVTQSYLTTSNVMSDLMNKEWHIHAKHTFSGSDSNQSRVYFATDAPATSYSGNTSAGVHGYYLKLGEALSGDVVRVYRDDAGSITLLASTTTDISGSFEIGIRITTDNAGNWSVDIDPTGGTNYINEANFSDNTYSTSSDFSIVCTYTSSNTTKFFYDDIYAGDIFVDTTPPTVISATATSSTTLDVLFSEALSSITSENESNYDIVGIGNPGTAVLDGSNPALVHLTFGSEFVINQTYTISASNIQDIAGNNMISGSADFLWFESAVATFRDVVFNEILADPTPAVALPESEFVEIHNTHATASFDLSNWSFVNTTTVKTLPAFNLLPGAFVILCDQGNVSQFTSYGDVIGISSFSALSNAGDSLTLLNDVGDIIDVLVYSDSWFDTPSKLEGGWTLEMINPGLPCQTSSNWSESISNTGGTPGAQNSVYDNTADTTSPTVQNVAVTSANTIQVTFTEAMDITGFEIPVWDVIPFNSIIGATWNGTFDQVVLTLQQNLTAPNTYTILINSIADCSGNVIADTNIDFTIGYLPQIGDVIINEIMADPDPQVGMPDAEYVELRNNTSQLLDITALQINSGYFTTQTFIQPDGFIIVADIDDEAMFSSFTNVAFMTSFPSLTNSGMALELSDANNTYDALTYAMSWYHDDSKADGGWSLERINPLAICSGAYNWWASTSESGGTAGSENSVFNTAPNGNPYVIENGVLSASQLYIRFTESMESGSTSNIDPTLDPSNSIQSFTWNSDLDQLILNTTVDLLPEQVYSLNITGLTDCDGNPVNPVNLSFLLGVEPQPGDIIINEIMADGSSESQDASPKYDYIELYNKTTHILDLSQINVNDGFFEEQVIIYPDSFIIITDADNDPLAFFAYPTTKFMTDFPSLFESGTTITVMGNSGLLDEVTYNKTFYHDIDKEDGGYSMELINPLDPCSSSDNWHACLNTNGTSAGRRNSVYDITPDVTAPTLQYILGEPQESVTLVFNEPIDEASLAGIEWTVNGVAQTNFNPILNGDEHNMLVLYYGEMEEGIIYQFELSGLTDCWQNTIGLLQDKFGLAETAQPGDIIINEVLYNPFEGGSDFVEIYNNSMRVLSLKDWRIADGTGGFMNNADIITELNYLLFPGEYLALGKNTSTLVQYYPTAATDRLWDVEGIADFSSSDDVFLLTPANEESDHFSYTSDLQYPLLNSDDGVSLERIAFNRPTSDNTNWHSAAESAGFATPGYINSQSELAMGTEDQFTVETEIFSPDNDGNNDIALFSWNLSEQGYTGDIKIYDSEGRFVRHLMKGELLGAEGSISWDGLTDEKQKASIGIYVIYFEAFTPGGATLKTKKTCVLAHSLN